MDAALAAARCARELADELRLLAAQQQIEGVLKGEEARVEAVRAAARLLAHVAASRGQQVCERRSTLCERLDEFLIGGEMRAPTGGGKARQRGRQPVGESEAAPRVSDARSDQLDGRDKVLELLHGRRIKGWVERAKQIVAVPADMQPHEGLERDGRLHGRMAGQGEASGARVGLRLGPSHPTEQRGAVLLDKLLEGRRDLAEHSPGRGGGGAGRLLRDRACVLRREARELGDLALSGSGRVVCQVVAQPLDHPLGHRVGHAAGALRGKRAARVGGDGCRVTLRPPAHVTLETRRREGGAGTVGDLRGLEKARHHAQRASLARRVAHVRSEPAPLAGDQLRERAHLDHGYCLVRRALWRPAHPRLVHHKVLAHGVKERGEYVR